MLRAMGLDPGLAMGAIRFSLGATNAEADVDEALAALRRVLGRRRSRSGCRDDALAGKGSSKEAER